MALVSSEIPGLLGGVSQQPAIVRKRNQASAQLNGVADARLGLGKRPPFQFIRNLGIDTSPLDPFVHWIDRDAQEKYVLMISNGRVRAYDLDGDEYPVNQTADATRYLRAAQSNQDLKAITIADTTFVMNQQVVTAMSSETAPKNGFWALVWIKGGNYGQKYTLRIAGRTYWFKTGTGQDATGSGGADETFATPDYIATSYIAESLAELIQGNKPFVFGSGTRYSDGDEGHLYQRDAAGALPAASWTILHKPGSSVIAIQHISKGRFKIELDDDAGGTLANVTTDTAQRFADLPNLAIDGHTVKVAGDKSSNNDDYWVTFEANASTDDGPSSGLWVESAEPGALVALDSTTFPYVIRRTLTEAGTVEFNVVAFEWSKRVVGNDKTNKTPEVVGRRLTDLTMFRGRLGLFAGTKFSFTQAGNLANFWRQTILAIQDDDPIHGEAVTPKVLRIDHAVPFNRELLLVSEKAQQVLGSPDALTTKTFSVQETAAYPADQFCRPLTIDNAVFLPAYDGRYTQIREFRVVDTAGTKGAIGLTEQVPQYLAGRPIQMAASSEQTLLTVLTSSERDVLSVYNWANDGAERAVSAWSKWDTGGVVLGMTWTGSKLWMLVAKRTAARRTSDARSLLTGVASIDGSVGLVDRDWINEVGDDGADLPAPDAYGVPPPTRITGSGGGGGGGGSPVDPGDPGGTPGGTFTPGDDGDYWYTGGDETTTTGEVVLVMADFAAGNTDSGVPYVAAVDYRVSSARCTMVYNAIEDTTTVTAPYPVGPGVRLITRVDSEDPGWPPGAVIVGTPAVSPPEEFTVHGDMTGKKTWVGEQYTFSYTFSPQIPRKTTQAGALVPVTTAQLQLLKFRVHYANTGYFQMVVTPQFRDPAVSEFIGYTLDSGPTLLDDPAFATGTLSTVIGADASTVDIALINDSHLPSWFVAAEWEGQIRSRSQRI